MLLKETKKLFYGKYKHKIILVTSLAHLFRHKNLKSVSRYLDRLVRETNVDSIVIGFRAVPEEDIYYSKQLISKINSLKENYSLRIENPWLSVYSNSYDELMSLASVNENNVKYFYSPLIEIEEGQIVMHDMPFDFKVTIGSGSNDLKSFVEWSNDNSNFKVPEFSKQILSKNIRWRQSYFYVKDEKNLLLAKLHVGRSIHKIEKIINKSANQSEKV